MLKLVGDNPFHGVSHLSQERATARGTEITNPKYAADLVRISLENGADGFMFSISDTTISILKSLQRQECVRNAKLFAITPAAAEMARLMGSGGGIEGMAKKIARQIAFSGNLPAFCDAINGIAFMKREALLKSFFRSEITRVKKAAKANLESLMLHEIITDMALALKLKWLFIAYNNFAKKNNIMAGYETRNFELLTNRFKEWNMEMDEIVVAGPFNKVGFQMAPSKEKCERALSSLSKHNVIAISVLAAGYLEPIPALEYIKQLSLDGVAIAVSNEHQAIETFSLLKTN